MITNPEINSIYVCGDIHGDFLPLVYKLEQMKIRDSVVIVAGDCGVGFKKENFYFKLFSDISGRLERMNNFLYLVRGNHDNPVWFAEKKVDLYNVKTIPDYSVVSVNGRNILCVGGAVSLDRITRNTGKKVSYWRDKAPVFRPDLLEDLNISIDTVVTHTAPSFCYPGTKKGMKMAMAFDPALRSDVYMERLCMDNLFYKLTDLYHPLTEWYYGHFHDSCEQNEFDMKFRLLDIMEIVRIE